MLDSHHKRRVSVRVVRCRRRSCGNSILGPGELAPWLSATLCCDGGSYTFDQAAGRHILILFYGRIAAPKTGAALAAVKLRQRMFGDDHTLFFGVTNDLADRDHSLTAASDGIRHFIDADGRFASAFGTLSRRNDQQFTLAQRWILLDPEMRITSTHDIDDVGAAFDALATALAISSERSPPIITVANLFDAELCGELIAGFVANGGETSGFMRNGAEEHDVAVKRRKDWFVLDATLKARMAERMKLCLVPTVLRQFNYSATHLERYLIARYDAGQGYFTPHRDNTTTAYRHRKFALTVNLNADYDGGELRFAEFGSCTHRPPAGGAILFSGALMHEVTPVTRGSRYAFLTFLFDASANAELERQHPDWPKGGQGDLATPSPIT